MYYHTASVAIAVVMVLGAGIALLPSSAAQRTEVFVAALEGGQEVPARDTPAGGFAVIRVSGDGSTVSFVVTVRRIDNAHRAHIHCGGPGVNGPIIVTLLEAAPGGGRFDGLFAKGSTSITGLTCTFGTTTVPLLQAIHDGNTYVNVHTNDGVGSPNTGPGDFPGGEIRGQLLAAGED